MRSSESAVPAETSSSQRTRAAAKTRPPGPRLTRATLVEGSEWLRARDRRLGAWMERVGDVGLRRQPHQFGALCRSILSQQLAARAAATIHGRFIELFAPSRRPSPEGVLALSDVSLRACGLSTQKIRSVRALASEWAKGELGRVRLSSLSDEEVIARLTDLPGIGRWTAEMFLIFALGRPDVFAAGDLALRTGIGRIEKRDALTPRDAEQIAARWSPWRSVASLYLWRIAHWVDDAAHSQ